MTDATEKQAALVNLLFEKTKERKLEWKPALRDEWFQVSFADYTVQIGIKDSERSDGEVDAVIQVLDSNGDIADVFTDVDLSGEPGARVSLSGGSPSWYAEMFEIYQMARRSARGADFALDKLLGELRRK